MIDREIFESHFRSCFEPLARYAFGFTKDREQSKEIVQEVFISLWEKRLTLKIASSLRIYLFQTVKNRSLNYLRDNRKVIFSDELPEKMVSEEEPQTMFSLDDLSSHVQQLPTRCREIFILKRIHGMTYKQIGLQMNISEKSVENQMTIAFKKLRDGMMDKEVSFK